MPPEGTSVLISQAAIDEQLIMHGAGRPINCRRNYMEEIGALRSLLGDLYLR